MLKPPLPHNETLRLKSLHALRVLDTAPEERFDRVTRLARNVFKVPIALVSLVDQDRQWFKSRTGLAASETPRDISFCGHAICGEEILVVRDARLDERFHDNPLVAGEPGIRFYAGCPLHAPDGLRVGTLCLIDRQPREFGDSDRDMLQSLSELVEAELASIALATTDELTGLCNRRGFFLAAPRALAFCQRNGHPATLVVMDLDGFKRINDELGHEAGDRALVDFAGCVLKACRESDIVARLGGDEFCGLFTGSTAEQLRPAFRRLRERVERLNEQREPGYPLGYSTGVAVFDVNRHCDLDGLLRAADAAMYEHKRRRAEGRRSA
ncbi:MAG: sensor domain-containing diguanylate cyclase [Gammaproteobacteria bacterium]|nr:MAG: sensor domain-containing diguanylate cyclase [Gammaproteobacteria bacterium]